MGGKEAREKSRAKVDYQVEMILHNDIFPEHRPAVIL